MSCSVFMNVLSFLNKCKLLKHVSVDLCFGSIWGLQLLCDYTEPLDIWKGGGQLTALMEDTTLKCSYRINPDHWLRCWKATCIYFGIKYRVKAVAFPVKLVLSTCSHSNLSGFTFCSLFHYHILSCSAVVETEFFPWMVVLWTCAFYCKVLHV